MEEEQEPGSGEEVIEPSVEDLYKLIMYFELTRRNYISLFKKLIMNNTELLEKLNIKMLQIIIAKELKIEEILNSVDMEMGSEVIEKYFLDSFCYEKKSR